MQTEEVREHIDIIMDTFDFGSVHHLMVVTKWVWLNHENNKMEIPNISQLHQTARELLEELYNEKLKGKDTYSGGTGGFYVYLFEYGVKLSFEYTKKSSF